MTRPVFIMCAGSAQRMGNALPYPKQFIRVNGEPLIERTLRLLRELGYDEAPFIVIRKGEHKRYAFEGTNTIELPEIPYESLVGNIIRAVDSARITEPVTILLGDVCWSRRALKTVLTTEGSPFLFGRFQPSEATGKPWDERFAAVADLNYFKSHSTSHSLKELPFSRWVEELGDYTDDIDFPHELETILPALERLAREEDAGSG